MSNKSETTIPLLKFILVGSPGVGKTSIITRYSRNSFGEEIVSTIGCEFYIKNVVYQNTPVKLTLWDTAGYSKSFLLAMHLLIKISNASLIPSPVLELVW
jgi:small GTP-binding protein